MSDRRRTGAWIGVVALVGAAAVALWYGFAPERSPTRLGAATQAHRSGELPADRARLAPVRASGPEEVRLEGRVLDLAGAPVAEADVRVSSGRFTTTTRSDATGGFAFDDLPPDGYHVDAATEDSACVAKRVHLRADTPPIVLRLSSAIRAEILVLARDTGKPVPGAVVEVQDRNGDTPFRSEVTDQAGKVALRGMPPDGYVVTVSATGFRTASEPIPARAGLRWTATISLASGAEVRGRVIDDQGQPVASATIVPLPETGAVFVTAPKLASDSVTTDDRGSFAITLDAGSFRLVATHPRYVHGWSEPFSVDGKTERAGVEITVATGGSIAGRVVTSNGTAAPYATVRSSATLRRDLGAGLRETRADGDGRFRIEGLPLVPMDLVASSPSGSSDTMEVDLARDRAVDDVLVTLTFDGVIAGVVIAPDFEPIVDAQVFCVGQPHGAVGTRPIFPETSDENGRFACRGLVPGEFSLTATRPYPNNNQGPSTRSVSMGGVQTGTTDVILMLPEDGALAGQVRLSDGSVPPSFGVSVDSGGLPRLFENTEDGWFMMDGLAPRTYDVTVSVDGFIPRVVANVQVPEGGQADLGLITLAPTRTPSAP